MQAFINSPAHYRNLVDPAWTHVGVGVTFGGDGRMYTTHNFMALAGGGGAAPAARHRRRHRRPPPRSPPTTAAPPPPPPPTTTTDGRRRREPEPTEDRVTAVLEPLRSARTAVTRRDCRR